MPGEPKLTGLSQEVAMNSIAPGFPARVVRSLALVGVTGAMGLTALPARAVDGCLVLLCLAAPSWRAIPQCVPPVRQLFRDLARGRPFPTCAMAGAGNAAGNRWASAPTFCPAQYARVIESERGTTYQCDYTGAISVTINGDLFARTWWSFGGDTVTEFTAAAKQQLGSWDPRFDDDLARWHALQPTVASTEASPGR
jgi:hypothetical protein